MNQFNTKDAWKKELQACYSQQAEHFFHTRKKFWPEVDYCKHYLQEYLKKNNKKTYSLVDLWAGTGRLAHHIQTVDERINYVWVDNAQWMIDVASKEFPRNKFVCADMYGYLFWSQQESIDIVVAFASIQHIKWKKEHQALLYAIYKALKWWWQAILVNWSFSQRFVQQYRDACIAAVWRSRFKQWWSRNDIMISRKDKNFSHTKKQYQRMYHIFTLTELVHLVQSTWFVIKKAWYVQQDWTLIDGSCAWFKSRNTFLVLEKSI